MRLQENTLFDNRYLLKRLIGRGGFAEVWLAVDNITHLEEALKVYVPGEGMDDDGLSTFQHELSVVQNLQHPNLLTPRLMAQCDRRPYLVMTYCSGGSLLKRVGKVTETEAWTILRQVAAGLAYLHENRVLHLDIKPGNILVESNGNCVITDFGVSLRAQSTLRHSMRVDKMFGTVGYMAPERFTDGPHPRKESDVWSLGAMLYELVEGDVPFNTPNGSQVQQNGASVPAIHAQVSQQLKDVITSMLALDPDSRPSAASLAKMNAPVSTFDDGKKTRLIGGDGKPTCPIGEGGKPTRPTGDGGTPPSGPVKPPSTPDVSIKKVLLGIAAGVLVIVMMCVLINAFGHSGSSGGGSFISSYRISNNTVYGTCYDYASERYITQSELNRMTSSERDILRNSIYARHGRYFKKSQYSSYFNQYSWYKPWRNDVPVSELNTYEKANAKALKHGKSKY